MTPYTGRVSAVAPPSHFAPPLQKLLLQVADAVQGVLAGQSLTELLARCPAELRPGTQALTFHVLRQLGAAQAARKLLAPKAPPAKVDSLLLSALALLWPVAEPAYADHTVVDQAVSAARKRAPASAARACSSGVISKLSSARRQLGWACSKRRCNPKASSADLAKLSLIRKSGLNDSPSLAALSLSAAQQMLSAGKP